MNGEKLRNIGLSPYEAKCYLSLVMYGTLSGKDIAKKSGVPPTSVYRNLESLQQKGFITVLQKEPLMYQAPNPKHILQEYEEKQKEELAKCTRESIAYLTAIKNTGEIHPRQEVVTVVSGKYQSYKRGIELLSDAKKEVLIIGRGEKPGIYDLSRQLQKVHKSGVDIKFITTAYDENAEVYASLKEKGISIKTLNINITMLIIDQKESQIVIKTPHLKEERIVLNIIDEEYSRTNREYFLTLWRKATPV